MTKFVKRYGTFYKIENGKKSKISASEYEAGLKGKPDWKLHIPEELPLPEVREYDSMEDAIAEED